MKPTKNWNEIVNNSNIMTKERKKNFVYQKENTGTNNWGAIIHEKMSTNIEDDYLIELVTDNKFMKSSLKEFTKLGNKAKINVDCYHRSNYPMTATDLIERVLFIKCEEMKKMVESGKIT